MASIYETAVMSQQAYQPNGGTPPAGWAPFATSAQNATGLQGFAYRNPVTNEIVVAFRGTQIIEGGDIRANLQIGLGNIPSQYVDAVAFYNSVLNQANENPTIGIGNYTVELTGHSLGGGLAQLLGAETGLTTATFNAPGMMDIWVNQLQGNPNVFSDGINNFNTAGDVVHLWDQQIGLRFENLGSSFGLIPDNLEGAFASLSLALLAYYSFDQHGIAQFVSIYGSIPTIPDNNATQAPVGTYLDVTSSGSVTIATQIDSLTGEILNGATLIAAPDNTSVVVSRLNAQFEPTETYELYIVQAGDTLSQVALDNNISESLLLKENTQITNPNQIFAGEQIKIPITLQDNNTSAAPQGTVLPANTFWTGDGGWTIDDVEFFTGLTRSELQAANIGLDLNNLGSVSYVNLPSATNSSLDLTNSISPTGEPVWDDGAIADGTGNLVIADDYLDVFFTGASLDGQHNVAGGIVTDWWMPGAEALSPINFYGANLAAGKGRRVRWMRNHSKNKTEATHNRRVRAGVVGWPGHEGVYEEATIYQHFSENFFATKF